MSGDLRYVVRRLLQLLPSVAGILLISFLIVELSPGDPVLSLAGESGDAAYYERMRERFGLDQPLHVRLGAYVANVLQGDLGTSYIHGRPALGVVLDRLPATLLLAGTAMVISSIVGIVLGVIAANRAGGVVDAAVNTLSLGFYAAPVFWVGLMALLAFSLHLGLFPVTGMTSLGASEGGFAQVLDVAHHLALPALVLASQEIAAVARLTRGGLIEQLRSDHVRTAVAKGARRTVVVTRHALRLALLPVITIIGARVGHLLSGAVVVELVFSWPGIGRLMITAVQDGNTPVLLTIVLLVAVSVILANLITDLAYGRLDPRIRLQTR